MENNKKQRIENKACSNVRKISLASFAVMLSLSSVACAEENNAEKPYTLTRVDSAGENTIARIELNTETQKFEPVYYRVDLTQTNYGEGNDIKYFEWSDIGTFEEVATPTEGKTTISVNYDSNSPDNYVNISEGGEGGVYGVDCIISNSSDNNTIKGTFIGNTTDVIYNSGKNTHIEGDFIGNKSGPYGIIYNDYYTGANIASIKGDFIGNSGASAISQYGESAIGTIEGNFINNTANYGGGAINVSKIDYLKGNFIGNSSRGRGGAIYSSEIGTISGDFIGNHAGNPSEDYALGGAIYLGSSSWYGNNRTRFLADGKTHFISGNYTEDVNGRKNNAIFIETSYSGDSPYELTFKSINNGKYIVDDEIEGGKLENTWNRDTQEYEYNITHNNKFKLKLTGDRTGGVQFNDSVINADVELEEINLHLTKADILEASTLVTNSGHLSLLNGIAETQVMQGMTVNGQLGLSADVDLVAERMDRLPANTVVGSDAQINVERLNLLNDATKDTTKIVFADSNWADQVSYTGESKIAYSPIYKYDVSYNKDDGLFSFIRGGSASGSSNPSEAFNPVVFTPSVASQAGGYATQMQTFNYAFQHADNFMNIPYMERLAKIKSGHYAVSTTTDSGIFSPLTPREEDAGYWVKPYVSFEKIPLKNGPKVSNINYGTLIGFDSNIKPISKGFERVITGYVGYNGASQSYSGVSSIQNGGLLGGTVTLYRGNFFNATTLSAGASVGESSHMYGTDDYTMFLAGIGNKLGYNFEFKDGRYIVQPALVMSYTFVNTFDYTNAAGTRINSDPLHAVQIQPGVKFIMNTENDWQPYAAVNMVWNVLDKQKVMADNVRLPEMSIKPYVQYGLGIQKLVKDKFMAFGQAMVANGGRNGVSLSFGLRWYLDK